MTKATSDTKIHTELQLFAVIPWSGKKLSLELSPLIHWLEMKFALELTVIVQPDLGTVQWHAAKFYSLFTTCHLLLTTLC